MTGSCARWRHPNSSVMSAELGYVRLTGVDTLVDL